MDIDFIPALLRAYFEELDSSFDQLSHLYEGQLAELPSYVFKRRHIFIFKFKNLNYYLIKVFVNNQLSSDKIETGTIWSNAGIWQWSNPLKFDFDFDNVKPGYGMVISNINVQETKNINSLPVVDVPLLVIVGDDKLEEWFSITSAKKRALDEWNNLGNNLDPNYSFIYNLKKIFDAFQAILNRRSFVERRLHRFLNSHSLYLLPSYKKCHFEFILRLGDDIRKADFILERELGFPPILIELESSFHRIFKKKDELTVYGNHAGEQIKEWVKFIESNSENASGNNDFLRGKKDRLVIVGRGLDCIDAMKDTKFGENLVWTYDLLAYEAKNRWNNLIIDQCKKLNISNPNLLQV